MSKTTVLVQMWELMRTNKKYWLAPIIIVLLFFGIILILAHGSALAPFIYTLF